MRTLIWMAALAPLLYLLWRFSFGMGWGWPDAMADYLSGVFNVLPARFPDDPIKYMSDLTGKTALKLLIITLLISPLNRYLHIRLIKYRRLVGLFTFFYAFLHAGVFIVIDQQMSPSEVWREVLEKPFIAFGMSAFLILAFMAATSTRKLFARFVKWHRLVYIAVVLIALHYGMSQKVIGYEPAMYIIVLMALLAVRLPRLRRG
jgi:sulfoxide reductase heme-binding subunit YedZ